MNVIDLNESISVTIMVFHIGVIIIITSGLPKRDDLINPVWIPILPHVADGLNEREAEMVDSALA